MKLRKFISRESDDDFQNFISNNFQIRMLSIIQTPISITKILNCPEKYWAICQVNRLMRNMYEKDFFQSLMKI